MFDLRERYAVLAGISLDELEPDAAARQLVERVVAVGAFRIENSHCRRYLVGREMMVADDEIHAPFLCIGNLLYGLNAAIQRYDQLYALAHGVVDAADRYAVTVDISVGNVERQILVSYLAQKLVYERYGRSAVHIVVAVYHHLLVIAHGLLHALHRPVHILHKEGIVQVGELRSEELLRLLHGVYASLYKQVRKNGGHAEA